MFGGDQLHPAYKPDVRLKPNQKCIGDMTYTVVKEKGAIYCDLEHVDGSGRRASMGEIDLLPVSVRRLMRKYQQGDLVVPKKKARKQPKIAAKLRTARIFTGDPPKRAR